MDAPLPAGTTSMFACPSLTCCCCAGAAELPSPSWPLSGAEVSSIVASSGSGGSRVGGSGSRSVALLAGVVLLVFFPFFCTFFQTPPLVVGALVVLCFGGGGGRGGPIAIGWSLTLNSTAGACCSCSLVLLAGLLRVSCCLQRCLFCPVVVA